MAGKVVKNCPQTEKCFKDILMSLDAWQERVFGKVPSSMSVGVPLSVTRGILELRVSTTARHIYLFIRVLGFHPSPLVFKNGNITRSMLESRILQVACHSSPTTFVKCHYIASRLDTYKKVKKIGEDHPEVLMSWLREGSGWKGYVRQRVAKELLTDG